MGTWCICLPDRGPTVPPVSNFLRWSFWKSWLPSCPYRVPTWSATAAVWRHTASSGRRLSRHHANRVSTARQRRPEPRIGPGPDCWVACLIWIWPPVFRHCVGGGSLATFRCAEVAHCESLPPFFRHCVGGGSLATFTQESVITRILQHCNLASVPPPIAPARCRQEIFAFDSTQRMVSSATCVQRRCISLLGV